MHIERYTHLNLLIFSVLHCVHNICVVYRSITVMYGIIQANYQLGTVITKSELLLNDMFSKIFIEYII